MVPFADAFNHKHALVQLSEDYVVEPVCYDDDSTSSSIDEHASHSDGSDAANSELSGEASESLGGKHCFHTCSGCWPVPPGV